MSAPLECTNCEVIFHAPGARCTVCGGELGPVVQGKKGTPWSRRDSLLWLVSFPGAEVIIPLIVVVGVVGVLV